MSNVRTQTIGMTINAINATRALFGGRDPVLATDTGHCAHRQRPIPKVVFASGPKRVITGIAFIVGEKTFVSNALGESMCVLAECYFRLGLATETADSIILVTENDFSVSSPE